MIAVSAERGSFTAMKESGAPKNRGASGLSVECFDASRWHEWDACVNECSSTGFFHSSRWMRVLADVYEFIPKALVFRRDAAIVGLTPMVEVNSFITGRRGAALPFADECAPAIRHGAENENLLGSLIEFARSQRWSSFELRGSSSSLPAEISSTSYYGHMLKLPADPNVIWKNLKGAVRTAIRKAESANVQVGFSRSFDDLRRFYELYRLTRQRHGHPPQPFAFFKAIHRHFIEPDAGDIVTATVANRSVAAAIFLRKDSKVLYKYGAQDVRHQSLRANNALFWHVIKRYCQEGRESLDLGRTSLDNEGLRRFKLGWGATEYRINYMKYDLRAGRFIEEPERTHGWHTPLFRVTPRWVSRFIGKVLYKHLA